MRLGSFALTFALLFAPTNLPAQESKLRVASAADLQFAMQELSGQFKKDTGTQVDIITGSSGHFFAQIESGAPFDLFFSADSEYPKKLEAKGFVEPGTSTEYALGRIVIWSPASTGRSLDVAKMGWKALLDARVQKIAIANPAVAPYGKAAVSALRNAGIYEQVKTKLIYGENISQTAQFAQSGNAQAAIVALSLALSPGMKDGRMWEIPEALYPPITQSAVLLKSSKDKDAARAFLDFVKSRRGREILEKYGFGIPESK